jgi:hypothetical protein
MVRRFDSETGTGFLSNYLLDPKHIFTDELSKNITKLAHNISSGKLLSITIYQKELLLKNVGGIEDASRCYR